MKRCTLLFFSVLFAHLLLAQDWVQVASLPGDFNQTHHSFGFSLEGKGYMVTGSSPAGPRNDFYQYDPIADEWTELDNFPGFARSFAIGDVWNGKAYFGFGNDGAGDLNDLWVFDPADMSWTQLASCPCAARTHPAFIALNDKIFVGMGGSFSGNRNDWWEYDMATDSWTERPNFPALPRHHPFQFGIGDYVYTGFGHGNGFISKNWYRYDPTATEWEQVADIPGEGRVAGTQFSHNGKGYVLSGDGDDHRSMNTGEFWEYDPDLDTWTELPAHPSKSRWAPSSFVIDGEVYILNGQTWFGSDLIYQVLVYKYDLEGSVNTNEFVKDDEAFKAFPNPVANKLQLSLNPELSTQDAAIRIYDVTNKLILQLDEFQPTLDVSSLPSGVLRVEVIAGDKNYFQTVVKR